MHNTRDLSEIEKMEYCYNLCKESNWTISRNLYDKTNLFAEEVRAYACRYIREVLKRDFTLPEFEFLMDKKTINIIKSPIVYYMVNNRILNPEKLVDFEWVIEGLDEAICEFSYNVFVEYDWIVSDIKDFCMKNQLSYKIISEGCRKYYLEYLKLPEKDFNKLRVDGQSKSYGIYRKEVLKNPVRYDEVIRKLLDAKKDEEVIQIMIEENILPSRITNSVLDYSLRHNLDYSKLKNELSEKLKCYSKYREDKRRKKIANEREEREKLFIEENLPFARSSWQSFLQSSFYDIKKYCKSIKVDLNDFKKFLTLLEKHENGLYTKYVRIITERNKTYYSKIRADFTKIINLIQENPKFDLLDYYEITSISPQELYSCIKDMTNEEYRLFRLFMAKYPSEVLFTEKDIDDIFKTTQVVDVEFDYYGRPVLGTGREILNEEKEQIMNYLNSRNIPITNNTYNLVFKKWLKGEININEDKKVKQKSNL